MAKVALCGMASTAPAVQGAVLLPKLVKLLALAWIALLSAFSIDRELSLRLLSVFRFLAALLSSP